MHLLVVNFHYVRESRGSDRGIYGVSPERMEEQLQAIGRVFEFVGLADLRAHASGGRTLPSRSCLVTLDDGLREQFELAWPLLRRLRVPAVFFVNSAPALRHAVAGVHKLHRLLTVMQPAELASRLQVVGGDPRPAESLARGDYRYDDESARDLKFRFNFSLPADLSDGILGELFTQEFGDESQYARDLYMTPAMWRELALAGALGTHAAEHRPLARLEPAAARELIAAGIRDLRDHAGVTVDAISYPYGNRHAVSHDVAAAARGCGLRFGFTMERAFNRSLDHALLLARVDTNDVPGGKSPVVDPTATGSMCLEGMGACRSLWITDAA